MSEVGRTQWKEACTEASKKKARLGNELGELVNAAVFDEEGVDAMRARLENTDPNSWEFKKLSQDMGKGKNATRKRTHVRTHTCQPCEEAM